MIDAFAEQSNRPEELHSEKEIRQFLVDQGCSFPDYSHYQNPSADEVVASPVFDDQVIKTTDPEFSFASLVVNVVRYANTFPIVDVYDDHNERRKWRKGLKSGNSLEKAAFDYLQRYNSLKINNITYAVTTCPLLALAVREQYPEIASELSQIGSKYLRLVKNERGESTYNHRPIRYKIGLTENLREEVARLLQRIVAVSDRKDYFNSC
jgi:hypothetical protein